MRIGLAVVATGRYVEFVRPLKASADEFFMRKHDVVYHFFCSDVVDHVSANVHYHRVPHEPWPGPTIHRYRFLTDYADSVWDCDYVFLCDADMRFVAPVGDEILGDLVGTIHPGFWHKPRGQFTYEQRNGSLAFIPAGAGERYYAGGFQGGETTTYLLACAEISDRIDRDEANGVTAVWHDESHWNRYLFENPPTLELDPGYCYPEAWDLPFERKLLALDKNHAAMRA